MIIMLSKLTENRRAGREENRVVCFGVYLGQMTNDYR